jgi:hypothetical protein
MRSRRRLEQERFLRGLIPFRELERREEELRANSEQILRRLTASAQESLDGQSAQDARPALTRTAKALWLVSQHRPDPEDMPGFYW